VTHDEIGQPEPARPIVAKPTSQLSQTEFNSLLTTSEKARGATPGTQKTLAISAIGAALLALIAVVVFNTSHFRVMDINHGFDSAENRIGWDADYSAYGLVLFVVAGALIVLAGTRLDVGAKREPR
jgi:hypothetical protein